jgi:hypothetical protein
MVEQGQLDFVCKDHQFPLKIESTWTILRYFGLIGSLRFAVTDRGYLTCIENHLQVSPVATLKARIAGTTTSAVGSVRSSVSEYQVGNALFVCASECRVILVDLFIEIEWSDSRISWFQGKESRIWTPVLSRIISTWSRGMSKK